MPQVMHAGRAGVLAVRGLRTEPAGYILLKLPSYIFPTPMPADGSTSATGEPAWRLARRRKIVAAASRLFGRAAYDLVQMDEVARQARVGKPTLYRYFPSKDELYLEVAATALAELESRLARQRAADAAPAAILARMVEILVDGLSRQVASLHLLTDGHSALAERWRRLFNTRRRPIIETLRGVIERGVAEGAFRPIDPEIVPALIIGMIRGGLFGVPRRPAAHIAAAAVDLVLHGAGATAAPPRPGRPRRAAP
jgi:AcrR family transcriptional regulator